MTIRRTAAGAASVAATLALILSPVTPAAAATSAPEVVGVVGSDYGPFYILGDGVYGVRFESLNRLDGAAPESVVSGFPSVGQGVAFNGALHIVTQDNADPQFESNVLRITPDGMVTTTLDLNTGQFLGGVRGLGATSTTMYASTWLSGGGVVRSTTDGTTWSTFTNPEPFPDLVVRLIGIGSDLYAQGSSTTPLQSGVFRFDGTAWTFLAVPGGVTTITQGVGRLLVGTSEGLYSIVGSAVTELVGDTVNPRTIAELGGVVYWVDDSNELRALESGVVTTPFPGFVSGSHLTATADELYFTASVDGVRSTYRVALLPTAEPETPATPGAPELSATGTNELIPVVAAVALGLLGIGATLLIVRARRRNTDVPRA